ncbi:MAG: PRC-barrel domain-containing protein, partial [Beijerinckiaceae bacterium]
MLWNASNIQGYSLQASDEAIGSVNDFLFGDGEWKIRWIVIDTGTWLPGKRVLLPPSALGSPDPGHRSVSANITKKQVEKSPSIDTDAPVSRQHEAEVYGYYGWQPYWGAGMFTSAGGLALAPPVGTGIAPYREDVAEIHAEGDPHLRSISEVTGYYIHAKDGDIGHVEDFL